jgi:hypothetical protein
MGRSADELRLRARRYREAADKGPRRERAFHLTYAFCLEQRANTLEQDAQMGLPGVADLPPAA